MLAKLTSQNLALEKEVSHIKKEKEELEKKTENEHLKFENSCKLVRILNQEKEILREKVSDFEVITLSDKMLIDQLHDELAKLKSEKTQANLL